MKHILLISYFYICLGICICQDAQHDNVLSAEPVQDIGLVLPENYLSSHSVSDKRSSAFKRLPSWSVYYGKRSADTPAETRQYTESKNVATNEELRIRTEDSLDITTPDQAIYSTYHYLQPDIEPMDNEQAKETHLKPVQQWMSAFGKQQSDSAEDRNDFIEDKLQFDDASIHRNSKRNGAGVGRAASWYAAYGKRLPAWSVTYGKRSPTKLAPFWSVTYGKRAPIWRATYGKRMPQQSDNDERANGVEWKHTDA